MKEIKQASIQSHLRLKALKTKWAHSLWRTPWKQTPLTSQNFSLNQCQSSSKVNQCMDFLSLLLSNSCKLLRLFLEVLISSNSNSSKPLWWEDFNNNNSNSNSIRLSHYSQLTPIQLSMEVVLKARIRNRAKAVRINFNLLDQKQLSHLSNNHPSCLSHLNKSLQLKAQCSMAINPSHPNFRLPGLMEVRHNQQDWVFKDINKHKINNSTKQTSEVFSNSSKSLWSFKTLSHSQFLLHQWTCYSHSQLIGNME